MTCDNSKEVPFTCMLILFCGILCFASPTLSPLFPFTRVNWLWPYKKCRPLEVHYFSLHASTDFGHTMFSQVCPNLGLMFLHTLSKRWHKTIQKKWLFICMLTFCCGAFCFASPCSQQYLVLDDMWQFIEVPSYTHAGPLRWFFLFCISDSKSTISLYTRKLLLPYNVLPCLSRLESFVLNLFSLGWHLPFQKRFFLFACSLFSVALFALHLPL